MDFFKFIKILFKRKYLLVGIPLFTMTVSYLLLKSSPNIYLSFAQLSTGITDDITFNVDDNESRKPHIVSNRFSNLIEIIKSKTVINMVSYRLMLNDLTDIPFKSGGELFADISEEGKKKAGAIFKQKLDSIQTLSPSDVTEHRMIKLIEEREYDRISVLKKLKVFRIDVSDYIMIIYESEDPNLSAFVVNTLCQEFIKYYKIVRGRKSNSSVKFFETLVQKKKEELDTKVNLLKKYKLEKGVINLYEQTKSIVDQIAKVEIYREKENKKIESIKKTIKEIKERLTGRDKLFRDNDRRPFNAKISQLKEKINLLNQRLIIRNESHLADSISLLRKQLNKQTELMDDNLIVNPNMPMQYLVNKKIEMELELVLAKNSVVSIDKEIERLHKLAAEYAPSEALISSYEREIQVAEEEYLLMVNKLNTATLNSLNLAGSLKQIEKGLPAQKPQASKKLLLMILSGIISFTFNVVVIILLEFFDRTIKTRDKFNMYVKLDLIGVVNKLHNSTINLADVFSNKFKNTDIKIFTQLIKFIRYEFLQRFKNHKSLLVTSTQISTGKTTFIISLAYAMHLLNKKVLLIDANFSNNKLTSTFNAADGLKKYLLDNCKEADVIEKTKIQNVHIIGCSSNIVTPFELDSDSKFKKLIQYAENHYDIILIEGPQLNKYPDSKELSLSVEKVVSVFSATNIIEEADKHSIEYLKSLDEKFMGSVLNGVSLEHIEDEHGEVKMKRSVLKMKIKSFLKRNFSKSLNKITYDKKA